MRELPSSVIFGYPEDVTVDAAFVAQRMGLAEEELHRAMRQGRVAGTLERGEAEDAGRVRITFRSSDWLWSAVVEPDGRGFELEHASAPGSGRQVRRSPRPGLRREQTLSAEALTLNRLRLLVRSVLLERAAARQGLSESRLLERIRPVVAAVDRNLIRRALAVVMHEDERAGRPFLPALVIADNEDAPWPGFMQAARRCRPGGSRCPVDEDGGKFWRQEASRAREFYLVDRSRTPLQA